MKRRSTRVAFNVSVLLAFAVTPLALASQGCSAAATADPSASEGMTSAAGASASQRPVRVMKWRDPSARQADIRVAATGNLVYYGGRVVSNMQVVQVLWGSGNYLPQVSSTASPSMATFYQGVLGSSYMSWLSEYNTTGHSPGTNQTIGAGSFSRQVQITPSSGSTTVDDATIQNELGAQISAGHLPAPTTDAAGNNNTYYAIFFPHGTTITQGGSSSCVAGGFCAYHGTIANAAGHEIYYGVHPDMQAGSGCDTGCGSGSPFQNYTSVASHEMIETVTDCEVGLATVNGPPLAWYDSTNGEIGDICNAQQGSFVGSDGVTYTVQAEWSNAHGTCYVPPAQATNDFSISDSPSSLSVAAGSSTSDAIHTAVTSGSAEAIALSASGQPSGVTISFSPTSVSSGGSSTMTINTTSATASGTYAITITGTAASGSHTTALSLTVTQGTVANDFSMAANPSSVSVAAGASGTSAISTAITAGSSETVALSSTGQPSGVTVTFAPTSVSSGQSSTMTIATTAAAAAGSYTLTVKGTAASGSHTALVALTITGGTTGGGLTNGGFETGNLSGWTSSGAGETVVSSGCHGGTYCAQLGGTSPTNGDSTIAQTFTAPSNATGISLYYKETCPDTVTYDWALATLKDNTAGTTATLLAKTCVTNAWTNVTGTLVGGHSYTLTLTSHDDNYAGDPTFTLFDDVTITTGVVGGGGITNGGFESGTTGWTFSGTSSIATSGCHGGTHCAEVGGASPTNGDSSATQTFTVPAGKSQLSVWYKVTCPDTVTYDWATITLKDNTTGTTTTILAKTCTNSGAWVDVTSAVTAGHSYTLTLVSHDDNYAGDPTFTLYDDVTLN